LFKILKPEF